MQLPPAQGAGGIWGLGGVCAGQAQRAWGTPAWGVGGQGDARAPGAQPRAEASWKALPAGLKPAGLTGLGRRVSFIPTLRRGHLAL